MAVVVNKFTDASTGTRITLFKTINTETVCHLRALSVSTVAYARPLCSEDTLVKFVNAFSG